MWSRNRHCCPICCSSTHRYAPVVVAAAAVAFAVDTSADAFDPCTCLLRRRSGIQRREPWASCPHRAAAAPTRADTCYYYCSIRRGPFAAAASAAGSSSYCSPWAGSLAFAGAAVVAAAACIEVAGRAVVVVVIEPPCERASFRRVASCQALLAA